MLQNLLTNMFFEKNGEALVVSGSSTGIIFYYGERKERVWFAWMGGLWFSCRFYERAILAGYGTHGSVCIGWHGSEELISNCDNLSALHNLVFASIVLRFIVLQHGVHGPLAISYLTPTSFSLTLELRHQQPGSVASHTESN